MNVLKKVATRFSSFWMDTEDVAETSPRMDVDVMDIDFILKLSTYKRAISNFVRILTNKNIPVVFSTLRNPTLTTRRLLFLLRFKRRRLMKLSVLHSMKVLTFFLRTLISFLIFRSFQETRYMQLQTLDGRLHNESCKVRRTELMW